MLGHYTLTALDSVPMVAVCITCKNASATIGYTLRSILNLNYPREKLYIIIVDGGSTDNTVHVAKKTLNTCNVDYKIIVRRCNIPEGRNICINEALKMHVDYIFFVDADVVIADRNLLLRLIEVDRKCGPCIVSAYLEFKIFKSYRELEVFCNKVVESKTSISNVKIEAVRWCGMGLTLIPAKIAQHVLFDEDLTFAEDRIYGFATWMNGYRIYLLKSDKPFAYDVNLPKLSNIYARMSFSEYLRGIWKKVLAFAYTYYTGSTLHTLLKFLNDVPGKRMLFHMINTLMLVAGLASILILHAMWGWIFIVAYLALNLPHLIKQYVLHCESVGQAFKNLLKYQVFSICVLSLMPLIIFKNRQRFKHVMDMMERAKCKL